jgi:CHAT domain-containing protein
MAAVMADKSLFSNASRIQHAAMLNHRNTEPDRYRRYLQLRSQVATHVADWQRGPGQGPDSEVVERIFADIRDAEAILLRPLQDWIPDRTFDHALLPEVKAVLAPGQVLLEFVRFQPLDMQNVRQCIVPSEDDDANYGVFVLAPASPVVAINLGPCTAIDAALRRYQQTFNTQTLPLTFDPDEVRLAESARELHDLLFAPLHPVINNAKRVYIAPVGSLSQLAFESVPLRAVGGVPRYLIESSQVVYLDSGRDLLLHQARNGERPVQDIVLFGDPAFNDRAAGMTVTADGGGTRRPDPEAAEPAPATPLTTWPPLPKTRRLVEGIATTATTAGLHARLCLGADASQSNLLQVSRPGVLAFATHGAYFKTGPTIRFTIKSLSLGPKGNSIEGLSKNELLAADPLFRSALVLAGANRSDRATSLAHDDGLFTAYEAWGLDLRGTELVVLAGCETGLGVVQGQDDGGLRQPPGEVVAGMRQAFTVAGARSLIMSMWPVDVGMTSRQFDRFFHLWLSQKQERVAALRNAQLEALAEARARRGSGHPIWWAGFSYVGDPGDRPRQGK